jgi:hypothetical protein
VCRFSRALSSPFALLIVGLFAVSCAHTPTVPPAPLRNPLVFIHGIMGAQLESNGNILWVVLEPGKAETNDLPLPLVVSQASSLELHNRSETEAKAIQYAQGRLGLTSKTVWLYFSKSKPVYDPLLESLAGMGFAFDVDKGGRWCLQV